MRERKARVAVVQLRGRLAFEAPGQDFLSEPLDRCILGELRERLPPDSPLLAPLARLQHGAIRAYCDALMPKLAAVVEFCGALDVDLVIFSEYVIPGQLLPRLVALAQATRCTLVAGTHLVTAQLLRDPAYRGCFGEVPPANCAIAPFVKPEGHVEYQDKLWRSQWETVLDTGTTIRPCSVPLRQGGSMMVGVAICIDFLRHRDEAAAEKHQKLTECDLIAVPSYTSKDTAPLFAHNADDIYRHFHRPVAYANHASLGGTNVFCFGAGDGRSLLPGSRISPMPAENEAVCIVDLSLEHPAATRPNTYLSHIPSELVTYSLILHEPDDRHLARVARELLAAPDAPEFHDKCERHQAELALASKRYPAVQQVAQRWRILAKGAQGEHGLTRLRMLARDVWLPDGIPHADDIERQLALGVLHTLHRFVERAADADERIAVERARDELQRTCSQHGWTLEAEPNDHIAAAVTATLSEVPAPTLSRPAIDSNGAVDPWAAASPPPANLERRGFRLWPARALLTARTPAATIDASERDLSALISSRDDLETAATFLALRRACPAWVGWSPGGVPVLVVPPHHVVFVTPVLPDTSDLREARSVASPLFPVVLLTGEGSQSSRVLDHDVMSLDRAIQRLATLAPRLRELSDFAYTPAGLRFVEPMCRAFNTSLPGLAALDRWHNSGSKTAVFRGRMFDGRTTLVRAWLARLARQALVSDNAPVFYHDCARSSEIGFDELLAGLEAAERAALRLAIRSGNCLLVLDGLDGRELQGTRLRFAPHVSDASRIMLVTCQQETPDGATVVELLPAGKHDQNALIRLYGLYGLKNAFATGVPRGFIATLSESPAPSPEALEHYIERHARLVDPAAPEAFTRSLEHLAFAMWSPFTRTRRLSAGWVPNKRFVRTHAERSGQDGYWPHLDSLATIAQPLIALANSEHYNSSEVHDWLSMQLAMRGSLIRDEVLRSPDESQKFYTIAWDPAAEYLLARHIVRALADGDATALDILPLQSAALSYAVKLPTWPQAQERLVSLLCAGLSSTQACNAVSLLGTDPSVGSTRERPWKLSGADLRALHIDRLRLAHADLAGARFCGCSLRGGVFSGANLTGADLHDCDLTGADFSGAIAVDADFSGADLDRSVYSGAVLSGADLSRTRAATTAPDLTDAVKDGLRTVDVAWASEHTDHRTATYDELIPAPPVQRRVSALAWSPDGHRLAVGYASGLVELWSAGQLRCMLRWHEQPSPIRAMAFSPAGLQLAVAGDNASVSVWNLADLSRSFALPHPDPPITGLWWEDGDTLWTFSEHPRRWSLANGALAEILTWVPRCFEGKLLADGRTLVAIPGHAGSKEIHRAPRIIVYDRASQRAVGEHAGGVLGLSALDPSGRSLIVISDRKLMLRAIDDLTATPARELMNHGFQTHPSILPRVGWSQDGALFLFVAGYHNGTVVCLDTAEFALRSFPIPFSARAEALLVSPRGRRVALVREGLLEVLDLDTASSHSPKCPPPAEQSPRHIEWINQGLRLRGRNFVEELDLEAGTSTSRYRQVEHDPRDLEPGEDAAARQRVYRRDGVFVIECDRRRGLIVLDEAPMPPVHTEYGGLPSWWFTPDGEHVLIQQPFRYNEQRTDIWCSRTGRHMLHFLAPDGGAFIVLNDGETLMLDGHPGPLILFDASRRALLRVDFSTLVRLCAAPDAKDLIGVDSQNGTVFRLDLTALCNRVRGQSADSRHDLAADDVPYVWRQEGTRSAAHCTFSEVRDIIAVCASGVLELRQRSDGRLLGVLPTGLDQGPAAFAPDGRFLACGSGAWIQIWHIDKHELAATIFRHRSGALFLAQGHFQPLRDPNNSHSPPCEIDGFYGRRGARLLSLNAAGGLARNDLLATFLHRFHGSAGTDT